MNKKKIVIAITGASGSIYAKLFLQQLAKFYEQLDRVDLVLSKNALTVWETELEEPFHVPEFAKLYDRTDFTAPFASGSADYDALVIIPCSMGTVARIANGISDDLITRTADVMLKERKKLVLVCRETPLSLIHLNNMQAISLAGGIICPAMPSFYSKPQTVEELVLTVVNRLLNLIGLKNNGFKWGLDKKNEA